MSLYLAAGHSYVPNFLCRFLDSDNFNHILIDCFIIRFEIRVVVLSFLNYSISILDCMFCWSPTSEWKLSPISSSSVFQVSYKPELQEWQLLSVSFLEICNLMNRRYPSRRRTR